MTADALRVGLDPLIAEAKKRAQRRRLVLLVAAGLLAAGAAGFELAGLGGSGGSGAVPWLPTKPNIGPAHPPLAPHCTSTQLRATLSLEGLHGIMATGGLSIVNKSSRPCSLTGRPDLSLAGAAWALDVRASRHSWLRFDPLAPPPGSLRALAPGGHALAALSWNANGPNCTRGGWLIPRALLLGAPGGGQVRLSSGLGSCSRSGALTLDAARFTPVVRDGPPRSALPLKARIVSPRPPSVIAAKPGTWLSYTVVLKNVSDRIYTFGRRCPAYTESWRGEESEARAYVLNCHPVGSIDPGQSVPFAMRIYVPRSKRPDDVFSWTLSPHTYNAPTTGGSVELR